MEEVRIKLSSSTKEFHSLNEIFDSDRVHNGDTITLLTDVTIGETVTIVGKKCTIDLGGNFIFIPIPSGILVKGASNVEFINGRIETLSHDQIEDALIVQGSKTYLKLGKDLGVNTKGTSVHVRKRGNLIVDGANVAATGTQPTVYVDDYTSTMTVEDGSVASYEKSAIVVRNEGSVVINNGKLHTEAAGVLHEKMYPTIQVNGKGSKFTVNGGMILSTKTQAIQANEAGEIEINGGEIYSTTKDFSTIELNDSLTSYKQSGGWVYSTKTSVILANKIETGDVQTINVTGGKVGAVGDVLHLAGMGDHGILFSAGTIKGNLPQKYIAAGYVISDIKDDEGYAPIILKTWRDPDEPSPEFPNPDNNPDMRDNPFEPVFDPDNATVLPFPTESVPTSGDYIVADVPDEIPESDDLPMPYPPIPSIFDAPTGPEPEPECEPDPFAPSPIPVNPIFPVPLPDFTPPEPPYPPCPPCPPEPPKPEPVHNCSVNIKRRIYIYNTPSRSKVITEWTGALRIISGGYFSNEGEEFALVKFKVPGSGLVATGYALVYDISNP